MISSTVFYATTGILAFLLCFSIYYNVKFGLIILRIQDSIEEALDILDERYANISQILKIPLFYDSPQIRQVISDIEKCQFAILNAAQNLVRLERNTDNAKEISEKSPPE